MFVTLAKAEAKPDLTVACTTGSGCSMPTPIMVVITAASIEMKAACCQQQRF
jgi:hypothetical protein